MINSPNKTVYEALTRFADEPSSQVTMHPDGDLGGNRVAQLARGDKRFFFGELPKKSSFVAVVDAMRLQLPAALDELDVHEVVVGVGGDLEHPATSQSVARGVRVQVLQDAVANLVGLPETWRDQQDSLTSTILRPLASGGSFSVVPLRVDEKTTVDAALDGAPTGRLIYIRADAGKGKSTTLAWRSHRRLRSPGILPVLLVPLRELKRSEGISWHAIAARLGAFGAQADSVASAVRAGLVELALDGLDEVAGRYDPSVVQEVLSLLQRELLGECCRVVVSGRTTESGLLDAEWSEEFRIVLPGHDEPAFAAFVKQVCGTLIDDWSTIARQLPESMLGIEDLSTLVEKEATDVDYLRILEWVQLVFEDLGKDRSLFFVQSLVGAARTYQLSGNRPLLIRDNGRITHLARPSVYDIVRLAISLACVREKTKIEEVASHLFHPARQLALLTWFAVLSSVPDSERSGLPQPNELTRQMFDVDPIHENEAFTALIRQMQKHALLYATGKTTKSGDWRPAFLSEWIRNALLVRAWVKRSEFPDGNEEGLARAVAMAEHAEIAYGSLFVDVLSDEEVGILVGELQKAAKSGGPEASSNFWRLSAALDAAGRSSESYVQLAELSDLSDVEFAGASFGDTFSSNMVVFCDTRFVACTFVNVKFTSPELSGAVFTGCTFDGCSIAYATGPCLFEDCMFVGSQFKNFQGREGIVAHFSDCKFDRDSSVVQDKALALSGQYLQVCSFADCEAEDRENLVFGDWLGFERAKLTGVAQTDGGKSGVPHEQVVLKATLKTFFPRRAGTDAQRQARPYIRSSALGRGALPPGAPSGETLFQILCSVGFDHGGRDRHLYAPWSSVAGAGEAGFRMRNELLEFLHRGTIDGATVSTLLTKIRREAGW